MFANLFGAKKEVVKEEPKVDPNAPSLDDTSTKLGERGNVIQTKVDSIDKELMTVKKEMLNAKGMRKKTLQQKAVMLLKRKKMYDTQLNHV